MSKSENAEERPVTGRSRLRSYGGQAVWAQVQAPRTEAELAAVLRAACAAGQPVTFHAAGRSFDTQALNDTMVVSLRRLDQIGKPNLAACTVTVGAGARWGDILRTTLEVGLVPYVMVTTSHATAGGTLSADSLSRFSPSCGKESRHIQSFRLMKLDGETLNCSRTDNPDVFRAAVAGFGYLGAVTEITYALLPLGLPRDEVAVETRFVPFQGAERLAEELTSGLEQG